MRVRALEAAPFAGVSLLGSLLAEWPRPVPEPLSVLSAAGAAFFLLWFAFLFNNWQDEREDRLDESMRDVEPGALSARANLWLAASSAALALGLAVLSGGAGTLALGLTGLLLSALYSARRFRCKQVPVLSSLLHLLVADLAFGLGWLAAGQPAWEAAVVGLFPGLLFAAGHLHHEAKDFERDRTAGVRTQAVRFGPHRTVQAGRLLWLVSPLPLAWFSLLQGRAPPAVGWAALALTAVYQAAAFWLLRPGIFRSGLLRLRALYRLAYLAGGTAMLLLLEPERLLWR